MDRGNIKTNNKNNILEVEVIDNRLVISIGVSTLAYALENGPDWKGKIISPINFARDMITVLQEEDETGQTVVQQMLDKAGYDASEFSNYVDLEKELGNG